VSLPRFYAPELDPDASEIQLPPDEARHLTRVLRLGAGAEVAAFDGRGREVRARETRAARDVALLAIVERVGPLRSRPSRSHSLRPSSSWTRRTPLSAGRR
jgi:16S rRNA U1498 N3-methylase RsmE